MCQINQRMRKKPGKKAFCKGFTLVELIVVIVIILVLAAVLVPTVLKYIAKSQEAACKSNRSTLYMEVCAAYADGEYDSLDKAFAGLYKGKESACPTGGTYTLENVVTDASGDILSGEIVCSEHKGDNSGGGTGTKTPSQTFLQSFLDFAGREENKGKRNDTLRSEFLKENGDKWPTLTTNNGTYNIQPYKSASGETWLFATQNYSDATNNWSVEMVYNPDTGKWYHSTTYSGALGNSATIKYDSLEDLNNAIKNAKHSNGKNIWVEVTDYKEN